MQVDLFSAVPQLDNLFPEQFHDLMGHYFRVVALRHFPFMDYTTKSEEPGSIITPTDCLDARFLYTFAAKLNFTYEIREQRERKWGVPTNGMFNGMMGELQREETDFCMIAAPTPERLQATEYSRGYPSAELVIVSQKPPLLPEYMALIRPFQGELWLALVISVVAWSVILWMLQRTWRWVSGGRGVRFNTTLLYGWGALLEQPPRDPSVSVSGQILVGWWLVFCLIIGTGFRSSLIAHLTVQGRSKTIESFQDLLALDNWKWGTERWLLSGVPLEYFSKHWDPVVKQIYGSMEIVMVDEALKKVIDGDFSFITFKEYVTIVISSRYTDNLSNTPLYISSNGIPIMAAFGWGMRQAS
ncbi:probable glutamate receptor [Panulirus ornatus]|uniref:probable glutamate receptor n=1 Tax=Panulirus ornatus TaxID=150431 RepID=UPI003A8C8861